MIEHGISPPQLDEIASPHLFLRWLRKLRDGFPKMQTYRVSLTPSSVAANTVAEQTFTVPGVRANDIIGMSPPGTTSGVGIAGARVSADDTVAVAFVNPTGGGLTPPAGNYLFTSIRL